MLPIENLLAFAVAATVLILIPGPSVLFTIGRTLALGRRGGLISVLGNMLGQIPLILAVAFGLGVIVTRSEVLFTVVKVAGSLYLVFLGVQAIRHRHQAARIATEGGGERSFWRQLSEAFVVGVTNPKTIAFFAAVLPQFVDLGAGSVPAQMIVLGLVFCVLAVSFDAIWVFGAAAARSWFGRSPKRIETLTATGGGMMIGLGGVLLFTGARH